MSVFIYLEDADVENGCTHVVPSSHVLPYAGPQSNNGGGTWADEHTEFHHLLEQSLPIPMSAGGVLLVHGMAFHSVGVNNTARTRTSLVFACHSVDDIKVLPDPGSILLLGRQQFRGNNATRESGSLALRRE